MHPSSHPDCSDGFSLRLSFAAVLFGLIVSVLTPVWPQSPANQAFEDIERRAIEARQARHLEEAVTLYRKGLKLRSTWNEGNWYLGTSLFGLKLYGEARDAFLQLAITQPGNGQAWAMAGMCEFELKDFPTQWSIYLVQKALG